MFQLNNQFCMPLYFITGQPLFYSNPPIFNPDMMIQYPLTFYASQISHLNQTNQIQRFNTNIQDQVESDQFEEIQVKIKDPIKKKIIHKNNQQKQKQSLSQAQRLRRKLANRPKTYHTQKKMYLKANLTELGIDQSKRMLRKKKIPTKKHQAKFQIMQDKLSDQLQEKQDCENFKIYNQQTVKLQNKIIKLCQQKSQSVKSLQFYNPQAQIQGTSPLSSQEIQKKKLSLISRRINTSESTPL